MPLFRKIAARLIAISDRRPPDFIVGGKDNPYLNRWWLLPRNPVFNVYLHQFVRDDDDRALHDHPWHWCSILLRGCYVEHTIRTGGIHRRRRRFPGSVKIASPWRAHRVELLKVVRYDKDHPHGHLTAVPCWTLFITGPRVRNWGFHCAERGWIRWQDFVADDDKGKVGRGCGEVQ
jgi:hypothetical protein